MPTHATKKIEPATLNTNKKIAIVGGLLMLLIAVTVVVHKFESVQYLKHKYLSVFIGNKPISASNQSGAN